MKEPRGRKHFGLLRPWLLAAASLGRGQQTVPSPVPVPAPVPIGPVTTPGRQAATPKVPGSAPGHTPEQVPPKALPASTGPAPQPASSATGATGGTVLFQSQGTPPDAPGEPLTDLPAEPASALPGTSSGVGPTPSGKAASTQGKQGDGIPDLTDREREAFTVTSYDLDLRLEPATGEVSARARLVVRNDGSEPLRRVPLQVSSTLRWESAGLLGPGNERQSLELSQHTVETDADHTGEASEAVLTLPEPLPAGRTASLDVFYSGSLAPSGGRLQRLGASADQAAATDWDGVVAPESGRSTALRGFGNVLWYPVVSPQLFLGDGNELFRAVSAMRQRERAATVRLRVGVQYRGEAPAAVYFCGRREALRPHSEVGDAPVALGSGVATAEFPSAPLGWRIPSLFLVARPELLVGVLPSKGEPGRDAQFSSNAGGGGTEPLPDHAAPLGPIPSSSNAPSSRTATPTQEFGGNPMLAVETEDDAALSALTASAERVAPLLVDWFGARPRSALTVLDAPEQPFQEGALLRGPAASLGASSAQAALAHSLTAAWVQTGQPWVDEGLAQLMDLLWTERTEGRAAALARLADLMTPVNLAEPAFTPTADPARSGEAKAGEAKAVPMTVGQPSGQPLVGAADELYYRRKAAAVWWMLREIAGEDPLRLALSAWRTQATPGVDAMEQARGFERLLEKTSGKELTAFFNDWVFHDRGLPDLTLVDVTPRQLPAGTGHDSGWLVAVTVRNDGGAIADVPLVISSGTFSMTRRLRVPGASSVTERVLVEGPPTEVTVNDGSTPEVRTSSHRRTIVARAQ